MDGLRLVVAVHRREVKTALFLALNGLDEIDIVATATSTAELISYCRAFRPDVVIVDRGLPGRPFDETLAELESCGGRILWIDTDSSSDPDTFDDVEHLVASLSMDG